MAFLGKRIGAVVPAYNEQALVARVIETMPDFVDHVVVVDDASTDATAASARAVEDRRTEVLVRPVNGGVGAAVLDGHRRLLELGCEVSVVMAGDAQMDPAFLDRLITPVCLGKVGFAKANRFFSANSFQGMPRHRVLGNVALSFLTKVSSGYWHLFDPQNGYTAISRDALELLDLSQVAGGYDFENSLLIHLNVAEVAACDVPVPARYGTEVSTIRLHVVVPRLLRTLWGGFWFRLVHRYVVPSFSAFSLLFFTGLALVLVGLLFGVFAVVTSWGPPAASAGTVLLSVAPLMTGVHLLVNALMLDIQASPR